MASSRLDHLTHDRSVLSLPSLQDGADLQVDLLRERGERLFETLLFAFNAVVLIACAAIVILAPEAAAIFALYVLALAGMIWLSHKFFWAYVVGNSVEVGPNQYGHVHEVVREAATQLRVRVPRIFILQGSGLVDILVAKYYTRRGYIIVLSDLIDALIESGTSRELLMLVGRQLGHLKAGHFRLWFLKDVIGRFSWLIHRAYWRRCHLTADRIGMMVAGDLYAAEQSLLILTVGPKLASHTNMDEIDDQAEVIRDGFWTRVYRLFSEYPHMIERIVALRQFAGTVQRLRERPGARASVGALPIRHHRLRSLPVMMVHGHDHTPLLELKDFLRTRFPNVEPVVMSLEMLGAVSMPEKFERLAAQTRGAIAILTPDDLAIAKRDLDRAPTHRARQNVVLEIGFFWGHLGRERCLFLSQGTLEIPSDLLGVECVEYIRSPRERFESVREFVAKLEQLESGRPAAPARMAAAATSTSTYARTDERTRCPECRTPCVPGSRYCEECGALVSTAQATAVVQ